MVKLDANPGQPDQNWRKQLRSLTFGVIAVAVFFVGGLVTWAAIAKIDTAVISQGSVSHGGQAVSVKLLTGGTAEEVLVGDGETVSQGDTILRLEDSGEEFELEAIRRALANAEVRELYLNALSSGATDFGVPDNLAQEPRAEGTIARYRELLRTGNASSAESTSVIESSSVATRSQRHRLSEQRTAVEEQIRAAERLQNQSESEPDTTGASPGLTDQLIGLNDQLNSLDQQISQADATLAELDAQAQAATRTSRANALDQLVEATQTTSTLRLQLEDAEEAIDELEVRAPADGIVHSLFALAPGSTLAPAEVFADIVSSTNEIIVRAQVDPANISSIQKGARVAVVFNASADPNQRDLDGEVHAIAPAPVTDPLVGATYFNVDVAVTTSELTDVSEDFRVVTGMPADVHFVTGRATVLAYLLEPLTDQFNRAAVD